MARGQTHLSWRNVKRLIWLLDKLVELIKVLHGLG